MSDKSIENQDYQHAALWLIGPDMPGLLNMGAEFVRSHGGNIDKDIADKFGEKVVVFMSLTAAPADIAAMDRDKKRLKELSGCGVVFQPMHTPTIPEGYKEDLYGFDIVLDDAPGLVAELTNIVADFRMLVVGHTGERRFSPGPRPLVQGGQKFVVMLPHDFDHVGFTNAITAVVKKHNGTMVTPLRTVPGLLWWW